ncbi:hypothetical protein EPO14_03855 [Patescibacteria group bacterium]|nr:MAG: hypothetical protein EPO14_03855 [Patescibacteria group bacterium]
MENEPSFAFAIVVTNPEIRALINKNKPTVTTRQMHPSTSGVNFFIMFLCQKRTVLKNRYWFHLLGLR